MINLLLGLRALNVNMDLIANKKGTPLNVLLCEITFFFMM